MSPSTLEEKTDNSFRLFFSAFTRRNRSCQRDGPLEKTKSFPELRGESPEGNQRSGEQTEYVKLRGGTNGRTDGRLTLTLEWPLWRRREADSEVPLPGLLKGC
ncbi:hypothetical protein SRHO_G00263630 [Serrasalmus rhombeus]